MAGCGYARLAVLAIACAAAGGAAIGAAGCGKGRMGDDAAAKGGDAATGAKGDAGGAGDAGAGEHASAASDATGAATAASEGPPRTGASEAQVEAKGAADPVILWTGSGLAAVWMNGEQMEEYNTDWGNHAWAFDGTGTHEAWMALFDAGGKPIGGPVELEGAGEGPKGLTGPVFAAPVWDGGKAWLAWMMCNESAKAGVPCRYVFAAWAPDGTLAVKPAIAAKDGWNRGPPPWFVTLTAGEAGPTLSWISTEPIKKTGCPDLECVPYSDLVKSVAIGADGAVGEEERWCGEVMVGFEIHPFGKGHLLVESDEHIGYQTNIEETGTGSGYSWSLWESGGPFKEAVVTGKGAAVIYDRTDDESFEVNGHCMDVIAAGQKDMVVKCARPASRRLEWKDGALAIVMQAKGGKEYPLELAPGDHVPLDLLRKAGFVKAAADGGATMKAAGKATDSVWTGGAIALVWHAGKKVHVAIVGPGGQAALAAP